MRTTEKGTSDVTGGIGEGIAGAERPAVLRSVRVNVRLFWLMLMLAAAFPFTVASFQRGIDAAAATKAPTHAVIIERYANGSTRVLTPAASSMQCCQPLRVEYQADGLARSGFEQKP